MDKQEQAVNPATVTHMRLRNLVTVLCILFSAPGFAESGNVDVAKTLFSHILDSRSIELFPFVPPIHLPWGTTVVELMLLLAAASVFFVYRYAFRKPTLEPGKLAIALETLVVFVRDEIVYPVMGEERGKKWTPFFTTLFLFLLVANFIGLIPAFKTSTGNINVTNALALPIFLLIFLIGFWRIGFVQFFKNFYPEGTFLPLGLFVAVVEFLGVFIKSGVLSLRIFANMFAGHMSILAFIMLIFILSPFCTVISIPIALFIYVLEVLVALIQAIVFTLLSCVFIAQASTVHSEA